MTSAAEHFSKRALPIMERGVGLFGPDFLDHVEREIADFNSYLNKETGGAVQVAAEYCKDIALINFKLIVDMDGPQIKEQLMHMQQAYLTLQYATPGKDGKLRNKNGNDDCYAISFSKPISKEQFSKILASHTFYMLRRMEKSPWRDDNLVYQKPEPAT